MDKEKMKMVKLTQAQQCAVNAVCMYNNFLLLSEGADGKITVAMNATQSVIEEGLRELVKNPRIGDLMTDIVIDYQNERRKSKGVGV